MDKQELVDILVQCAMMIHDRRDYFDGKSFDEIGEYMRRQLTNCGVKCTALGSNHVYLLNNG